MDVLQRRDVELDDGTASTRLPDFMVFLAVLVAYFRWLKAFITSSVASSKHLHHLLNTLNTTAAPRSSPNMLFPKEAPR